MSQGPEFQVPYRLAAEDMTLRDYFAAAALQGILVESAAPTSDIVKWAYDAADAMMAERAKKDKIVNAAIFEAAERQELQSHEISSLRLLLSAVVEHFGKDGNGPGHAHLIPGVWDKFNRPEIAGKPCEWCATWRKILEAVK